MLSLPGISGSVLEEILIMITKAWGQQTFYLDSKHIALLDLLGIPALSSHVTKDSQSLAKSLSQSSNNLEGDQGLTDLGGATRDPSDENIDGAKEFSKQDVDLCVEPRCVHCDTLFMDRTQETLEEILVHLGEVHFEVELDAELKNLFTDGSNTCKECYCEIKGD